MASEAPVAGASIETKILTEADGTIANTYEWAEQNKLDHMAVVGVVKSLEGDKYVVTKPIKVSFSELTAAGQTCLKHGSPEFRVFQAAADASDRAGMEAALAGAEGFDPKEFNAGWGKCMRNKWLKFDKKAGTVTRLAEAVVDAVRGQLEKLDSLAAKDLKELKKRGMVTVATKTAYKVSKGEAFAAVRVKPATELTKEMLEGDAWKTQPFKDFNFEACGKPAPGGHLHPLLKVRAEFRSILLEMGFEEMPTAKFVESSFWNFDSLFQPQSHPARDAHDTFFIANPASTLRLPEDYVERVKSMHQTGGHGSIGYRYDWKRSEANKNLLRTHTTAVSAQMLYRVAQQATFKPVKMFSIDRVFRNEALDATHLAEFHQVEGVVADYNLSLGDLIGVMREFFGRWGIEKLRFKPAYNPYTEPSMEIFAYHPDLKCWTEIGNSGIFRPEMLMPMGLPKDVRVIAWGLSLERPTMIRYGINNIRTLFGHQVKLHSTRDSALCNFQSTDTFDGATHGTGSGRPYPLPGVDDVEDAAKPQAAEATA